MKTLNRLVSLAMVRMSGAILAFGFAGCSENTTGSGPSTERQNSEVGESSTNSRNRSSQAKHSRVISSEVRAVLDSLRFEDSSLTIDQIVACLKSTGAPGLDIIATKLTSPSLSPGLARAGATKFGAAVRVAYGQSKTDASVYFGEVGSAFENLPIQLRDDAILELSRKITAVVNDGMPLLANLLNGNPIKGLISKTYGDVFYDHIATDLIQNGRATEVLNLAMRSTAPERFGVIANSIRQWSKAKPIEASLYVDSMPIGLAKDQAIVAMIEPIIEQGDIEAATKWAACIQNADLKSALSEQIGRNGNR